MKNYTACREQGTTGGIKYISYKEWESTIFDYEATCHLMFPPFMEYFLIIPFIALICITDYKGAVGTREDIM